MLFFGSTCSVKLSSTHGLLLCFTGFCFGSTCSGSRLHMVCCCVSLALALAVYVVSRSCLHMACCWVSLTLALAVHALLSFCLHMVCCCVSLALALAVYVLARSCLHMACCWVSLTLALAVHALLSFCLHMVCCCVLLALALAVYVLAHLFLYECSSNARFCAFLSRSLHCLAAVSSSDSTALLRFIAIRLLCLVTLDLAKVWPQTHTDFITFTLVEHCSHTLVSGILS